MQVDDKTILQPEEKYFLMQLGLHFQIARKNRYFCKLILKLSYVDMTKSVLPESSCLVLPQGIATFRLCL